MAAAPPNNAASPQNNDAAPPNNDSAPPNNEFAPLAAPHSPTTPTTPPYLCHPLPSERARLKRWTPEKFDDFQQKK